jgi:hypothetical protein
MGANFFSHMTAILGEGRPRSQSTTFVRGMKREFDRMDLSQAARGRGIFFAPYN